MSQAVFPTLSGFTYDRVRSPTAQTIRQSAVSGREVAATYQVYPLHHFSLNFEFLKDTLSAPEYDTLTGFILSMLSGYDSFLFTDWSDSAYVVMNFGTGDGFTTAFQLTRTFGAGGFTFTEPVQNINGTARLFTTRYGTLRELMSSVSRTNLLIQSGALSTWSLSNISSVTTSGTAPDGTSTAQQFVDGSSALVAHSVSRGFTMPAGVTTFAFSVFVAKPSTFTEEALFCRIAVSENTGGTQVHLDFDITAGTLSASTVGANWSTATGGVVDLGNGWLRVFGTAIKTNGATAGTFFLVPMQASGNQNYTGTSGNVAMVVWGPQCEVGTEPTMYLPTGASTVTATDYTINANAAVTVTTAPQTGAALTWDGAFYYRCRFDKDEISANAFMSGFWDLKRLDFTGSPMNRL